jgi:hypothetical protein
MRESLRRTRDILSSVLVITAQCSRRFSYVQCAAMRQVVFVAATAERFAAALCTAVRALGDSTVSALSNRYFPTTDGVATGTVVVFDLAVDHSQRLAKPETKIGRRRYVFFTTKSAWHAEQRTLSKSTRCISDGGMEYPHEGQGVFNAARTFSKLILFLCTCALNAEKCFFRRLA